MGMKQGRRTPNSLDSENWFIALGIGSIAENTLAQSTSWNIHMAKEQCTGNGVRRTTANGNMIGRMGKVSIVGPVGTNIMESLRTGRSMEKESSQPPMATRMTENGSSIMLMGKVSLTLQKGTGTRANS